VSFLQAFGSYLPSRVVGNEEIGAMVGSAAEWILNVSGIEERRFAARTRASPIWAPRRRRIVWHRRAWKRKELGMLLVASGSSERRFPGPAAGVARRLGLDNVPAIDLPMASAGSLFGMALATADGVVWQYLGGGVRKDVERGIEAADERGYLRAVRRRRGRLSGLSKRRILEDCGFGALHGRLFFRGSEIGIGRALEMNGPHLILQASRKNSRAIGDLLEKHGRAAADVACFLLHQANQNLIVRVAEALG